MTPHPSTVKAAREIVSDYDEWELAAAFERECPTEKSVAALIEESCHVSEMAEALQLAEKWLANCVPVAMLDGPHPLPVIAAALAKVTK